MRWTAQTRNDAAGELAIRTLLAPIDLRALAQQRASIDRARLLAQATGHPPAVRNAALVLLAEAEPGREKQTAGFAPLLALADDPQVATDALAQDTALLLVARWRSKGGQTTSRHRPCTAWRTMRGWVPCAGVSKGSSASNSTFRRMAIRWARVISPAFAPMSARHAAPTTRWSNS